MEFTNYLVIENIPQADDVFRLRVKPENPSQIFSFLPGQFCMIKNPLFENQRAHAFSIACSPTTKDYLEFSIRMYGQWTKTISTIKPNDTLQISGPLGRFVWTQDYKNAVFLAGGVGITPIISMLGYIKDTKQEGAYTLLYGSRTEPTILYKQELEQLTKEIKTLKVVHILSEVLENDSWTGYKGFITSEILQKEIDFTTKPDFFLCGPPIFTQKMKALLQTFQVDEKQIKQEIF